MTHGEHLNTGIGADVAGSMHSNDGWGIHFEAYEPLRIERVLVDADQAGQFTVRLEEYDGSSTGAIVEEQTYNVNAGYQEIHLGFEVDSAGQYLLSRQGTLPLRRISSWSGFPDSYPFMELIGGAHPDYSDNDYYYYFFDMEVAVDASASGESGSYVEYHDIDDYGADPSGANPSDQALEDAVAAADPHDWIVMTNGDYLFDDYHLFGEPYTIDADGSTLECTQYNGNKSTLDQNDLYDSHEAVFTFEGSKGSSTGVSSTVSEGQDQVPVDDASLFDVGDDVLIKQSGTGYLSRSYEPTRAVIRDIDGSTLHLHTPCKYDYDGDSVVVQVDPVVRPRVKNAYFTGDAGCHVSFVYTREARAENCTSDGYRQHAYSVVDGLDTEIVDCHASNPINLHGSHGETFRIVGSTDVSLVRPVVDGCRRGIDLRSGCKTLRILEPKVKGATLYGFSFHNGNGSYVNGGVEITGGVLSCRITDPTLSDDPNEYQLGNAFSGTQADGYVKLEGVDLVCRDTIMGSGPNDVYAVNCRLRTAEPSETTTILDITGSNVTFENVTIENGSGSPDYAVEVEGTDVRLSGRIRGDYSTECVRVANAENVSLDLDVQGWSESSCRGIRIFSGVDDVDIAGTFDGAGRSIVISGDDVKNVTVNGANCKSDFPPIAYAWNSDATGVSNVQVLNCDVTGGTDERIVFNEPVDGLWIKNNVCSGITTQGHSNEFVRDNLVR